MGGIIMSTFTKVIGVALDNITKVLSVSVENAEKVLGGGPSGDGGGEVAGTFFEEDAGHTIFNDTSTFTAGNFTVNLDTNGYVAYDSATGETVNDEFRISWWQNLSNVSNNQSGNKAVFGRGGSGVGARRFGCDWGIGLTSITARLLHYNGSSNITKFKTGVSVTLINNWNHFAIRIEDTGSALNLDLFINGSKISMQNGQNTAPQGTKILPPLSDPTLGWGGFASGTGKAFGSQSVTGQIDSIQIGDGVALTDSQIAAIAGQSDRQMSIETAAGL